MSLQSYKKLVDVMKIEYLITIPVVILAAAKVLLHGQISRQHLQNVTDVALYNIIMFSGMVVIYLIMNGTNAPLPGIWMYGTIYGTMLAMYQNAYTMAMQRGPLPHTALIVSFNVVFTVIFGLIYCNETLNIFNIIGFVCMFTSLVLTVDFKQAKAHQFSFLWFFLCLLTLMLNGICNIVLKVQAMDIPDQEVSMLLVSYIAGTIVHILFYLFQRKVRRQQSTIKLKPAEILLYLGVSVIYGGYYILYLLGIASMPSVVILPVSSIGSTTLVALASIFIFKAKQSPQQIVSLVFGFAATLMLCL